MRTIIFELPWDTFIVEVVSQTNLVVALPVTPWRKCGGMLKARAWGEVRAFSPAGATTLAAQMGLQFANVESDTPVARPVGPVFTANGWQSPGATPYADISDLAGEKLLVRGVWLATVTLNPGTAHPFFRASGTVEILTQ